MRIRDSHATLRDDATVHEMPSGGLDIIADDGRTLFGISLKKDGTLRIDAGHNCKHGGVFVDDTLLIAPVACNAIELTRPKL